MASEPTSAEAAASPDAARVAYLTALFGADPTKLGRLPRGGCVRSVEDALFAAAPDLPNIRQDYAGYAGLLAHAYASDEGYLAAVVGYRECMASSGFDVPEPGAGYRAALAFQRMHTADGDAVARALATRDVSCATASGVLTAMRAAIVARSKPNVADATARYLAALTKIAATLG